jgi:hypothetical protein
VIVLWLTIGMRKKKKCPKLKDSYLKVVVIVLWLTIGMRKKKKCPVQISLGLLMERQWEWKNNFSCVEVQEMRDLFVQEEFESDEEEFEEDEDFMVED